VGGKRDDDQGAVLDETEVEVRERVASDPLHRQSIQDPQVASRRVDERGTMKGERATPCLRVVPAEHRIAVIHRNHRIRLLPSAWLFRSGMGMAAARS